MANAPRAVRKLTELRSEVALWRKAGERVALVPTMGALHEGHLSLVRLAHTRADRVVASIFVNPAQFAPTEDFDKYPRTWESDLAALASVSCDLVWAPTKAEMYPDGFATRVAPAGAAEGLETQFRPHFFGGVATVVCKLFLQCQPDVAIFGEKDYQQLQVITQMVRDLDIPVEVIGAPTVREADGLAMSSRNAYLSAAERATAVLISQTIREVAGKVGKGEDGAAATAAGIRALTAAGYRVDYLEVCGAADLKPIAGTVHSPARVLVAAWLGKTRLIDNVAVEEAGR